MRCNCHRSIVSTPRFRRLLCACWIDIRAGRAASNDWGRCGRGRPWSQIAAVGMQRLANEPFGNVGAVGIGGVDEIDAEFGQPAQRPQRFGAVRRRAPDSGPVTRIAPKPRRCTFSAPPIGNARLLRVAHRFVSSSWMGSGRYGGRRLAIKASAPAAASRRGSRQRCRRSSARKSCRGRRAG